MAEEESRYYKANTQNSTNVSGSVSFSGAVRGAKIHAGGDTVQINWIGGSNNAVVTQATEESSLAPYKSFDDFISYLCESAGIPLDKLQNSMVMPALEEFFQLFTEPERIPTDPEESFLKEQCILFEYIAHYSQPLGHSVLSWLLEHPDLSRKMKKHYKTLTHYFF